MSFASRTAITTTVFLFFMSFSNFFVPPASAQSDNPDAAVDSTETSNAAPESESAPAASRPKVGEDGKPLSIREQLGDPFTDNFEWLPVDDSAWGDTLVAGEPPQNGAVQLFSLMKLRDSADYHTSETIVYNRIRITGDKGVDNGEVEWVGYEDDYDGLEIRGRTMHPGGEIVELDSVNIRKVEDDLGDDVVKHTWTFSLPAVTDDCIIEYYIRVIEGAGSLHRWDFQQDVPCRKSTLFWYPTSHVFDRGLSPWALEMLAGLGLDYQFSVSDDQDLVRDERPKKYLWRNVVGDYSVLGAPEAEPRAYAFTVIDVPAFEPEPVSFPESYQRANLLMYRTPSELKGSFWVKRRDFNLRYYNSFKYKRKKLKKAIKKTTKDLPREEWIPTIYHWVQDKFLNINCALWYSEKELAKKLRIPLKRKRKRKIDLDYESIDIAIRKRIASPFQINMIFNAAMEDIGLESELVYVVDRSDGVFIREVPIWQFDRAVVAVKDTLTGEVVCYDPASPFLAPGETLWQTQGVTGLVGAGGDRLFLPTPSGEESANTYSKSYNITELTAERWKAKVTERFTGQPAIAIRRLLWPHEDQYHVAEVMRYLDIADDSYNQDSVTLTGVWEPGEPLTVSYMSEGQFTQHAGGNVRLVRLGDIFGDYHSPFSAEKRVLPIVFDFPYTRNDVAQFSVDVPWKVGGVPDPEKDESDYGYCMQSVRSVGKQVSIQRRFVVGSPFVPAEEYQGVRDLFSAREKLNEDVIALTQ